MKDFGRLLSHVKSPVIPKKCVVIQSRRRSLVMILPNFLDCLRRMLHIFVVFVSS
ncbi:hypothetical protein HanPSC8_Chr11g0491301 [Helianthus annuus]|nr:hypothetical protein HanPSC8_Chr11g0491301 [Helianthus annuus]